jgi:hypothetical protein
VEVGSWREEEEEDWRRSWVGDGDVVRVRCRLFMGSRSVFTAGRAVFGLVGNKSVWVTSKVSSNRGSYLT